jgi:hypothetical protein
VEHEKPRSLPKVGTVTGALEILPLQKLIFLFYCLLGERLVLIVLNDEVNHYSLRFPERYLGIRIVYGCSTVSNPDIVRRRRSRLAYPAHGRCRSLSNYGVSKCSCSTKTPL